MTQVMLTQQAPEMTNVYTYQAIYERASQEKRITGAGTALPSLSLLGGFQLTWNGGQVTMIDMPRLRSLLAYLALHSGTRQSRTHLAFLIWPDSTEAQAHTNLRNLIFKLRQALPGVDAFISTDRHSLLWNGEAACTLDVQEFEQALAEAEVASNQDVLRQALERAINLYRGDLLPDCYDEWIIAERDRLQQAMLYALECLITLYEQEHDYTKALRMAQRLQCYEPLLENTYCHLMRLHAKRADRSAIVRTYQNCAAVLKRELGIGPGKATWQAFQYFMQEDLN